MKPLTLRAAAIALLSGTALAASPAFAQAAAPAAPASIAAPAAPVTLTPTVPAPQKP